MPPAAAPSEKKRARRRGPLAFFGSLALHAVLLGLVVKYAVPAIIPPREDTPIEIVEMSSSPPAPEPEPREKTKAPQPDAPKPEPREVRHAPKPNPRLPPPPDDAPRAPPRTPPGPPPPNQTSAHPSPADKTPVHIGISMDSTSSAGTFATSVGNTLYGKTGSKAPDPKEVKAYADPNNRYVLPSKVKTAPRKLHVPELEYTKEAREQEIQGTVILMVTVDATGKVIKARVLQGLGYGLDEVAVRALQQARFEPGTDGEGPVTTEVRYLYTFKLTN